ncbi:MAG: STAS domain-containing protein [Nocardioidaceae bacterium]
MSGDPRIDPGAAADQIGEVIRFDIVDHAAGARVMHVVGEVDTLTAPVLRTRVDEQLAEVSLLVLDLSSVTFLGSAGLAVLVAAKAEAERQQNCFRLVLGSRIVTRALEATGLVGLFDIADGVPQALAAAR